VKFRIDDLSEGIGKCHFYIFLFCLLDRRIYNDDSFEGLAKYKGEEDDMREAMQSCEFS